MWGQWNYMHWIMILRIKPSWRALFWHTDEHPHSSFEDKGWTQPLKPRIQQRLLRTRSQREILSQIAVRLLWDSHSQRILTGKSYVGTVLLALFFPQQASLSLQRIKTISLRQMPQQTAHSDSGFHCGVLNNKPTLLTGVYFLKLLQRAAFSCYYLYALCLSKEQWSNVGDIFLILVSLCCLKCLSFALFNLTDIYRCSKNRKMGMSYYSLFIKGKLPKRDHLDATYPKNTHFYFTL